MHSLHVGYVGLMGNLHYVEMVDFLLGWAGWDITRDDRATFLAQQEAAQQELAALSAEPPAPAAPAEPPAPAPSPPRPTARRKPATLDTTSLNWRP